MRSPQGLAWRREQQEFEAHMMATSFVYRHATAFFVAAFGMILGMMIGFGYFLVNGNAGDHIVLLGFDLLLGFVGVMLVVFTFGRVSGASLLVSVMIPVTYVAFCGLLAAASGVIGSFLIG